MSVFALLAAESALLLPRRPRRHRQAKRISLPVFPTGAATRRMGERRPPPETRTSRLDLSSGGAANTLWGGRVLQAVPAGAHAEPGRFVAEPENPVPGFGGDLGSDPV